MNDQNLLFEQLKSIKDYWRDLARKSLNNDEDLIWTSKEDSIKILRKSLTTEEEKKAYQIAVNDIIEGAIHSILVMIDGGDALAEKLSIDLIDIETNKSLSGDTALHEEFLGYLLDIEDEEH
ncbi:histidine kinase [Paenisporosarcina sp. OV554]|uniref:histidine kinase n=1 Tax=Paenisporosarcina sp. OV554 TaxID=2135694 RepID=UPI000D3CFDD0|nr:histidine kinase [Paenisporosarcina sp. OV554]PUB06327.1 hypothetical protein C8K15_1496 [Paenisporosarcina sp. OV554]